MEGKWKISVFLLLIFIGITFRVYPFFAPAYDKNQKITVRVMGEKRKLTDLKEIFSRQMQKEYFPVELDTMGAKFDFLNFGDKETFYGANITAVPQHHKFPGGSYGLRIEDKSGVIVVCTDVEHINGIDQNIVELARNADVLIHDAQYTDDEYELYKGWGHSTWRQAVEVARLAGVKLLILTHHDPDHDDDFLDSMEIECKKEFPDCLLAREGMEFVIS
jgi:ribonuclease BN (tRNA processing enzyme)